MVDWSMFVYGLVAALLLMNLLFFVARKYDRYDLVDIAWGLVFIAIALVSYTGRPFIDIWSVQTIATVLVIVWGFRLIWHIQSRWSRSKQEDKRYQELRKQYRSKVGGVAVNMYLRVFVVQAILAVVVAAPLIMLNAAPVLQPDLLTFIGVLVWLVGFYFEAIGDMQLARFTRNHRNKGRVMMSGLWRYTRHPNYFGEVTQWWGVFIIALAAPHWCISIAGPVLITLLILFVSGIPLTEKHFEGRPGWKEYKKRTSPFFPLPPRR